MDDLFGEPIHVYTREQAIADGVLAHVGNANVNSGDEPISICFTVGLMGSYEDAILIQELVKKGLGLLSNPDPADDYQRFRVIDAETWVIWDGEGITFLRPEDY
jgi:hypothetical protein